MNDFEKAQAAKISSFYVETDLNEIAKAEEILNNVLSKARQSATVGTIKAFGGRDYIKTTSGWKFHGKGGGVKAKEHKAGADTHKEQSDKSSDKKELHEHAKEASEKNLKEVITNSPDPKLRAAAHKELDRRNKEEYIQEEPKEKEKKPKDEKDNLDKEVQAEYDKLGEEHEALVQKAQTLDSKARKSKTNFDRSYALKAWREADRVLRKKAAIEYNHSELKKTLKEVGLSAAKSTSSGQIRGYKTYSKGYELDANYDPGLIVLHSVSASEVDAFKAKLKEKGFKVSGNNKDVTIEKFYNLEKN